jgi:hypothetical protein
MNWTPAPFPTFLSPEGSGMLWRDERSGAAWTVETATGRCQSRRGVSNLRRNLRARTPRKAESWTMMATTDQKTGVALQSSAADIGGKKGLSAGDGEY